MSNTLPGSNSNRPPVAVLGVVFDNVNTREALEQIQQMIASGRPHYVATANVDFLVQARADVELRRILLDAHLVLCDGTPVVWASRLLGNPLPERVAGADLVPLLIQVAVQKQYRLFFLGASPDSAQRAVQRLRTQYPGILITGHYSPPFGKLLEMDHEEVNRQIRQARPDLLFVAFGCPKQEKWIAMHYRSLGVPVSIGVGATIDFLAGQVRRAPRWMQRCGAEWIFRLAQEPRRLCRRYLKDLGTFASVIIRQWSLLRTGKRRSTPKHQPWPSPELPSPSVAPALSMNPSPPLRAPETLDLLAVLDQPDLAHSKIRPQTLLLDLARVRFIDSSGIAWLMRMHRELRSGGGRLLLVEPSRPVRRALGLMRWQDSFDIAATWDEVRQILGSNCQEPAIRVSGQMKEGDLAWHGEITAANGEQVWVETRAAIAAAPPCFEWRIDLSNVRFMDSTGLGLMVRAKKLACAQQQELYFVRPQAAVRNVLQLARLEDSLIAEARAEKHRLNRGATTAPSKMPTPAGDALVRR